jgi:hypothetical protein
MCGDSRQLNVPRGIWTAVNYTCWSVLVQCCAQSNVCVVPGCKCKRRQTARTMVHRSKAASTKNAKHVQLLLMQLLLQCALHLHHCVRYRCTRTCSGAIVITLARGVL